MAYTVLDDGYTSDTSANYQVVAGGILVTGGALRGTSVGSPNVIMPLQVTPDTTNARGPIDVASKITVKTLSGGSEFEILVRESGGGANSVGFSWASGGGFNLYDTVTGVLDSGSQSPSSGDVAWLDVRNGQAKAYINGVEVASGTTTVVQAGNCTLIMTPSGSAANLEVERWQIETYTPYLVLVGTAQSGIGDISPAWPSGHLAGDYGLLMIESTGGQAASLGTAAGFSAVANSPSSTGATTSGTRLTLYDKIAAGAAESTPTVTDPGDHAYGLICVFRGCDTTTPVNISGANQKASASTSLSVSGVTTTAADCLVLSISARDTDSSAAAYSGWTNANLYSLQEFTDAGTTQGNGGGIGAAFGVKASAGATGATTGTVSSSINANMMVALAPPSSGTAISAGFDSLVITERTAAKALSRNVVGALDALVITERTATVKVSRAVAAALDALTIAEQAAVLRLSRSVIGAVDALVLTESQATVSVDTAIDIAAGLDALLIAEQAASAKLSRNVVAGFDALAITEQAAVIRLAKAIAGQVDALLIAEHGAAISSGLSLAAAVDNLLITERTAAVNARRQVAASTDALLVSELAAEVRLAKLVSAGVDALLISEQQAVKALSKAIAAGVDQLLITEGQVDVDGIAAVISVVAQRVVYPQRDGMVDIAGRGQVAIGPRNSRITVH